MIANKERILLIGTGAFITDTVLPAIIINQKSVIVSAVVNKNGKLPAKVQEYFPHLSAQTSLSEIDKDNIDAIFICVPQAKVIALLKQLIRLDMQTKKVIIATPIVPLRHIMQLNLCKAFTRLYAFEFVPQLPTLKAAKKLIDEQKIGKVKKIQLNHCGYLYHGIAALRYLAGHRTIAKISAHRFGVFNEYQVKFNNALNANILEPKDYQASSFFIAGEKGTISDYTLNVKNHFHLDVKVDNNGVYQGIAINNDLQTLSEIELTSSLYFADQKFVPHIARQLFIIAAASLLNKVTRDDKCAYQCFDAIYEHLIIRIAKKLGCYINPLAYLSMSPLNAILKKITTTNSKGV